MKKVAIAVVAIGVLLWAKKHFFSTPRQPSKMEMMAEKVGLAARSKMKGQPPASGLTITETASSAPSPNEQQLTDMTAAMQSSVGTVGANAATREEGAKMRVDALMEAWKKSGETAPDQRQTLATAACLWSRGTRMVLTVDDLRESMNGFDAFVQEKQLGGALTSYEVGSAYHRDTYSVVDVNINGALYHLGVPDDNGPISWTF